MCESGARRCICQHKECQLCASQREPPRDGRHCRVGHAARAECTCASEQCCAAGLKALLNLSLHERPDKRRTCFFPLDLHCCSGSGRAEMRKRREEGRNVCRLWITHAQLCHHWSHCVHHQSARAAHTCFSARAARQAAGALHCGLVQTVRRMSIPHVPARVCSCSGDGGEVFIVS